MPVHGGGVYFVLTRYGTICHSSQPPCSSRIRLPFASTCSPDAAAALQLKPGLQRPSSCEAAIWGGRSRARGGAGLGGGVRTSQP